ncbi:nucleotidyltransferase family protein [Ramlibacter sp.]|uniref:nucleotidyltransferase family protein n=1 Tax=Ramlibacter sp. TaxID=1917967 RepID=UPI001841E655|nr:nucleotidyltransferase family protein [Ramlibacter sp.]MBA2672641.1 nucleotidyltransferase family protein [Ramlibacter sp.]
MILAAGRGERMRPLTDTCPKPLLEVRGKPLMLYHMEALGRAGLRDVVINTAWLGEQIEQRFGAQPSWTGAAPVQDGDRLRIRYSHEGLDFGGALETAGGILRALPLLDDCFWLVGGDVHVPHFAFSRDALLRFAGGGMLAHLVLVPNPEHNPKGDFGLGADGMVRSQAEVRHTYSTIAILRQALFDGLAHGNPQGQKATLAPLLRAAMDRQLVTGELYTGPWADIGTPARLAAINAAAESAATAAP